MYSGPMAGFKETAANPTVVLSAEDTPAIESQACAEIVPICSADTVLQTSDEIAAADTREEESCQWRNFEAQRVTVEPVARLKIPSHGNELQNNAGDLIHSREGDFHSGKDIRASAFQEAWVKRQSADGSTLTIRFTIAELFVELNRMNNTHRDKSYFRKGVGMLNHVIKYLNFTLSIATPFANLEPAAASSLAIVQTVVVVCYNYCSTCQLAKQGVAYLRYEADQVQMAAVICGAESALQEKTEELLYHIPIIDRCEDLAITDSMPEVRQALVLVYDDLLDFYFEVRSILRSKNFIATLTKSAARHRISGIVSSFSNHTESLFRDIDVETSLMVKQIMESQLDESGITHCRGWNCYLSMLTVVAVRQLLKATSSAEVELHNRVKDRADDACEWISSDQTFQKWTDLSSDLHCVSLIGNMGNGKTFTASFVAKSLQDMFDKTNFVRPAICSYYCRDDNETSKILNIYRSLVQQLLNKRACLIHAFFDRYKRGREKLPINPTESADFLSTFLFDTLTSAPSSTKEATYIIIDGLDECAVDTRNQLLEFFNRIYRQNSRTKLFLSHRPDEDIKSFMPENSRCLYLQTSKVRDHQIATYIVAKNMRYLSQDLRNMITDDLSEKADGCAIWVWLVVDYLRISLHRKAGPIRQLLAGMPSPQKLEDLYVKLFERAVNGAYGNMRDLALILELLTLALRPLTLMEVACAVSMGPTDAAHRTFAEVDIDLDVSRTRQLARSFIRIPETDDLDNAPVSLVHQSLKEVVLKRPPNEWLQDAKMQSDDPAANENYGAYVVSQSCIRYLLLEDLDSERRMNSFERGLAVSKSTSSLQDPSAPQTPVASIQEYPELWAQSPIVGTFFAAAEHASSWKSRSLARRFKFYEYAINFWAIHFRQCQPPAASNLHTLAIELYKKMSPTDWDDHLQTGNDCSDNCPVCPDPLTMCCFFGHLHVALQVSNTFEVGPSQIGSAFYWASHQGHLECIKLLHPRIDQNVSLCYYAHRSPLAAAAANGHAACVEFILLTELFDINERDSSRKTALALAVIGSHVQVTSTLLAPQFKDQLDPNLSDNRGWSPLFLAQGPNASTLASMLLKDERTDPNMLDSQKRSALSWACEENAYDLVELFVADKRIKLDILDASYKTPLIYAIASNNLKIVKCLFSRCQNENVNPQRELNLDVCDTKGRNAVSWASSARDVRILEFLLQYASHQANVPDNDGWAPLAWTLDPPGYPRNSALLLPYIKEHINERDCSGNTVLSTAIIWGRPEIAKLIIQHSDIDVNLRSNSGRTSLSFAASAGYLELVKLLIETKNADPSIVDSKGLLPVGYAKDCNHTNIVDYLDQAAAAVGGAQQLPPDTLRTEV